LEILFCRPIVPGKDFSQGRDDEMFPSTAILLVYDFTRCITLKAIRFGILEPGSPIAGSCSAFRSNVRFAEPEFSYFAASACTRSDRLASTAVANALMRNCRLNKGILKVASQQAITEGGMPRARPASQIAPELRRLVYRSRPRIR
jgi:hypothetical protein